MNRPRAQAPDRASTPRDRPAELKVFISHREAVCGECQAELERGRWIFLAGERGAICLACADLDHLVFLPSGDAALTRRAKKYSRLSAVVLKFSRAQNRYERQGILVDESALARAEVECFADEEARQRRRLRDTQRREGLDERYLTHFAERIRALFPGCPPGREYVIAEHTCLKHSGRIGRSVAAKQLDEEAVRLAVAAHVRHVETNYDELLGAGWERSDARSNVIDEVERILDLWAGRSG